MPCHGSKYRKKGGEKQGTVRSRQEEYIRKLPDGKTEETGKCAEISAQRVHEKEKMDYEI